jgi:hypothetical protein
VTVPVKAKQAESAPSQWAWVDRAIWTERMLAALGNGVKGSKWSHAVAECLLRKTGIVHHDASPNMSEPTPMRKPLTGEPCAGEPQARFGGRGGRESFSTPIKTCKKHVMAFKKHEMACKSHVMACKRRWMKVGLCHPGRRSGVHALAFAQRT